jgi:hypothetical protein
VEHSLHSKLGEHVFEEANSPLTVSGAAGTDSGNMESIKEIVGEVERSRETHQLTGTVLTTTALINERTRELHKWRARHSRHRTPPKRYM